MINGIFIPIEIMRREYISKLLLSIELTRRGMPVIIGHKDPVLKLALESKEPGVLFYKSTMAGKMEKISKLLRKKKFKIVVQDEEAGMIFENYEDFYKERASLESINELDLFFTWGKDEYDFLIKKFDNKIIENFGGLRSCFWGDFGKKFYQNQKKILNDKFGDYILIVSNLATFNEYLNKEESIKHASQFKTFNLKEYNYLYEIEKRLFSQYLNLIEIITKKLDKKVIVRPHPTENIKFWKKKIKNMKNVFIEKEGELLPWILASEFIIQNNCTSAIEAAAADIPVVTFVENKEDLTSLSKGKENISNQLSINILGEDNFFQIAKNIKSLWNKNENKIKRSKILNRKLKDYGKINAAKNIANKIIDYVDEVNPKGYQNLGKDSIFYDIYELYRLSNFRPNTKDVIMDLNKRESLSVNKVKKDLINLTEIMKINYKIKIRRIERNTFYIYPRI